MREHTIGIGDLPLTPLERGRSRPIVRNVTAGGHHRAAICGVHTPSDDGDESEVEESEGSAITARTSMPSHTLFRVDGRPEYQGRIPIIKPPESRTLYLVTVDIQKHRPDIVRWYTAFVARRIPRNCTSG
jgi:hypothetical protein